MSLDDSDNNSTADYPSSSEGENLFDDLESFTEFASRERREYPYGTFNGTNTDLPWRNNLDWSQSNVCDWAHIAVVTIFLAGFLALWFWSIYLGEGGICR
ncbi:uncharacterized protein BCR38DRAFT_483660 [Pseudomassariella vexata]|uniref:Uncharacterized protein n=1 Tax=Pseudomassariella vexata TaxID=1141098 RepID=A0A1Y2E3Y0_9PEZI|nr:uncharacterized protein BCR38DRAFT_483660 [Pseudomassariella vexata]ORY65996.1 hypothetical protein BCR38DRAFT_483660 [Pseudomassariella vexata]